MTTQVGCSSERQLCISFQKSLIFIS